MAPLTSPFSLQSAEKGRQHSEMSVYRMNGMEKNGEEHMCVKDRIIKRAEDTAFVIVEICVLTCGISPSFWKSSLNRSVTMYIPGERISVWATYCGFKNCSGRCTRQSEIPWWFQEVHTAAVRYSKSCMISKERFTHEGRDERVVAS